MNADEPQDEKDREPEGLGEEGEDGLGDYPIDTLLIRTENRTVFEVVRRMGMDSFIMDPDFQRDFIWPEDKQSKLIESVLMRIPLPVLYLAEDEDGRMIVVDGLQRLSTFQRFINNQLRLKLPKQQDLNKKRFKELSPKLQNRVEDCNLILYIIDAKVPERARLDIFDRVNSGVPLSRQQMRNCLYTGQATRFLRDESRTTIFQKATGSSLNTKIMRDREFVNRFCAFHLLPVDSYKGDMDDFLATSLLRMNRFTKEEIDDLAREFQTCLENNLAVFGRHAFRKHKENQRDRSVLNASLWDVMTTGLARVPTNLVQERSESLKSSFYRLMEDNAFIDSITYSPNSTTKVKSRFDAAKAMFQEVFDADTA